MIQIIPRIEYLSKTRILEERYEAAYEYNDFYDASVLDDPTKTKVLVNLYKNLDRDCSMDTLHGAYREIAVHSKDKKIRDGYCRENGNSWCGISYELYCQSPG